MAAVFLSLVLLSSVFSALFGGMAGRWTAFFAVLTTLMGVGVSFVYPTFATVSVLRIAIDIIFMVALVWLAVAFRCWWLIWMAAFQINGTAAHFAALLSSVHVKPVYYFLTTVWGIPILVVWVFGIAKDRGWRLNPVAHLTRIVGQLRDRT
ncbi:hypothetical protein Q4610_18125 [Sphingobium sp. HBC34]|uniref:Uncharacterized protein n=1 Tax=Sphingobium cyanobacteriorum TaxID=3063954 RepID=A0ABT8ZQZ7_9SPHN|nr:hypothetical protein [Sphingobium sp. HBC34]MDO7836968.1 hypothetical protein [Sphingobium sp. HBC34]